MNFFDICDAQTHISKCTPQTRQEPFKRNTVNKSTYRSNRTHIRVYRNVTPFGICGIIFRNNASTVNSFLIHIPWGLQCLFQFPAAARCLVVTLAFGYRLDFNNLVTLCLLELLLELIISFGGGKNLYC